MKKTINFLDIIKLIKQEEPGTVGKTLPFKPYPYYFILDFVNDYDIDSEYDIERITFLKASSYSNHEHKLEIVSGLGTNYFIIDGELDRLLETFDNLFRKSELRDEKLKKLGL